MRLRLFILLGCLSTIGQAQFSTTASHIRYGAALPSTCSAKTGDVFALVTGTTAAYYNCTAANTWTAGGGGPTLPLTAANGGTNYANTVGAAGHVPRSDGSGHYVDGAIQAGDLPATLSSGTAMTNAVLTTPSMTPQVVDCHAACSPTAANLSNAEIANYGQGASSITITGPTLAAGMNFIMIVGTAQASNYWQYTSTTANVYLDSGGPYTNVGFAAPAVGNSISCFSFQTGASTYSLRCVTLNGASSGS